MAIEDWAEATRLIRGGISRSEFDETAEAIYTTSGFVYGSAEEAQAAFAGTSALQIAACVGSPARPTKKRHGCSLKQEAVHRAASKRWLMVALSTV